MNKLKKTITFSIFICLLLSIFIYPTKTYALEKEEYRRVINNETPFYEDNSSVNLLFYLPYTYYVKLLSTSENYAFIECYGDDGTACFTGYTIKDMLFKDDLPVENPYLDMKITTINATCMYYDYLLTNPKMYLFADRQLKYYGYIKTTNGYSYLVMYNGKIGYVSEKDISPFTVKNHPNPLTFIKEEETKETKQDNIQTVIIILVIVCFISAGILALFVCFSKKKKVPNQENYYDENDFE